MIVYWILSGDHCVFDFGNYIWVLVKFWCKFVLLLFSIFQMLILFLVLVLYPQFRLFSLCNACDYIFRGSFEETNKDVLIGIALSLQSKMESSSVKVLEESKLLNDKIGKLEADVAIARNANSLLSCLVDTERQRWANAEVWTVMLMKKIWMLVILLRTRSELL